MSGHQKKRSDRKYRATIQLTEELSDRIRKYLGSPGAAVKTRDDLVERSLCEFLNKEELIIQELEFVTERIRSKIRY